MKCVHACVCMCTQMLIKHSKQTEILIRKVYCGSKELFLSCYCNISNCNVRKPEAETAHIPEVQNV